MDLSLDKILDVEKLPQNAVIVIKMEEINSSTIDSLKQIGERYNHILNGKNISVFVLRTGESFESYDEEQMSQFGWVKKCDKNINFSIERTTLNNSLLQEVKNGSQGALKELAELVSNSVQDKLKMGIEL